MHSAKQKKCPSATSQNTTSTDMRHNQEAQRQKESTGVYTSNKPQSHNSSATTSANDCTKTPFPNTRVPFMALNRPLVYGIRHLLKRSKASAISLYLPNRAYSSGKGRDIYPY